MSNPCWKADTIARMKSMMHDLDEAVSTLETANENHEEIVRLLSEQVDANNDMLNSYQLCPHCGIMYLANRSHCPLCSMQP